MDRFRHRARRNASRATARRKRRRPTSNSFSAPACASASLLQRVGDLRRHRPARHRLAGFGGRWLEPGWPSSAPLAPSAPCRLSAEPHCGQLTRPRALLVGEIVRGTKPAFEAVAAFRRKGRKRSSSRRMQDIGRPVGKARQLLADLRDPLRIDLGESRRRRCHRPCRARLRPTDRPPANGRRCGVRQRVRRPARRPRRRRSPRRRGRAGADASAPCRWAR